MTGFMVSGNGVLTFLYRQLEKPRELPHVIFLLSLKLYDPKLMLKLYYFSCATELLY